MGSIFYFLPPLFTQNVPISDVALAKTLRDQIKPLKKTSYSISSHQKQAIPSALTSIALLLTGTGEAVEEEKDKFPIPL